jgi:hypothetical protein
MQWQKAVKKNLTTASATLLNACGIHAGNLPTFQL